VIRTSLEAWLGSLPSQDDGHLLIGATGHLRLSAAERRAVADQLRGDVLPTLIARACPLKVSLVTGLAPGADLTFKQVASDWLEAAGISYDMVAVLAVPMPTLIDDWLQRMAEQDVAIEPAQVDAVRADIQHQLERCAVVVDLVGDGLADPRLAEGAFRRQQYRILAACLAEQSDVLIAILRPGRAGLPGGSAEVVDWRYRPARVPAELSTLALRHPLRSGRPLLIIDPTAALLPRGSDAAQPRLDGVLAACQTALRSGNYLLCHDLATRARTGGVVSRRLEYLALLSLANAGSTQLAMRRFRELGEPPRDTVTGEHEPDYDTEEWLALRGRLLKDLALTAPPSGAAPLFAEAGRAYARAYDHAGGYFPGINAATMLMLGGLVEESRALAERVLRSIADLARRPAQSDAEHYYRRVTEAEAALLLGRLDEVATRLASAVPLAAGNVNALSRTRAQLRLISRHLGHDETCLAALRLPPVLFVASGSSAAGALPASVAFVGLGLVTPDDLAIAEHYRLLGVRVHVVLPAAREPLLERWQRLHGSEIALRLALLLDDGVETSVVLGFVDAEIDICTRHVSATACGLSRLEAQRLGCEWQMLPGIDDLPSFTAVMTSPWTTEAADGLVQQRRMVGTLFADFSGYSRLPEAVYPVFQRAMVDAIASVLDEHRPRIRLQHTWGDAVHVVTDDAETTARIAEAIHGIVERARGAHGGVLARVELRLSAHYAPVFEGHDRIDDRPMVWGSQLAFAARIEPVTPPGMIYVTEAFAARLMLEAPDRYAAEYAGEIELAKRYGKYRLYALRR
jgi:hypothetical protein